MRLTDGEVQVSPTFDRSSSFPPFMHQFAVRTKRTENLLRNKNTVALQSISVQTIKLGVVDGNIGNSATGQSEAIL